jgi:SAM-dependent methyltransferase
VLDSTKTETCQLCGSPMPMPMPMLYARDLLSDSPATYPVIKCSTCSLMRTLLPERLSFSRYPAEYHRQIALQRDSSVPEAGRSFENRMKSVNRFKRHGRILDVGCGDGAFLKALRTAGWEVCGTEIDGTVVNSLLSQGLDVHEGRLPELKFPSDHFDVITYFGAFEHVEQPLQELAEVRRILKKDGCLLLNLTNAGCLEARLFGSNWFGFEVPRHCFNYTLSALNRLLASADFACLKADAQHNDFITSFSLACRLGLKSYHSALRRPLDRLLMPVWGLARLFGQDNVLEVVAACREAR